MPQPPPPLPYQTPQANPPRGGSFDWPIFLRTMAMTLAFCGIMYFVVPRFEDTFRDFKLDLPLSTKVLLRLSDAMVRFWWAAIPLLMVIPVGLAVIVGQLDPSRKRLARLLVVLFSALIVVFIALGLFQPMTTLMDGITNKK